MTPSLFPIDDENGPGSDAGPLADLGHGTVPMIASHRCPTAGRRVAVRVLVPVTASGEPVARDPDDGILTTFYAWVYNRPAGRRAFPCPGGCGRSFRAFERVGGTYSDKVKCNARCTGATGPDCECQCAGRNHGGKWSR